MLIDSRLPPQAIDLEFLQWLEGSRVPFALIFTKTDKQSATRNQASIEAFLQAVRAWRTELPDVLVSSSTTRAGRGDILNYIADVLEQGNRTVG